MSIRNRKLIYIFAIIFLFNINVFLIYKSVNSIYRKQSKIPLNFQKELNISSNDNTKIASIDNINNNNIKKTQKKTVYLTFDDGPSINNTKKIIKILNENNIKATFFVTGNSVVRYPEIITELHKNKMAIAPHSYSHDYKLIYSNSKSYIDDLEKCIQAIEKVTKEKPIPFTRIPGGIKNKRISPQILNEIKEGLKNRNIYYVEWNICSDDSIREKMSSIDIRNNVISQSKRLGKNKVLIVLMHDSYYKQTTVDALPSIIKFYKNSGWEFRALNNISSEDLKEIIRLNLVNTEYREK
ncbi:peptidoglycan-N-acetylglucosamine deacetylase [Clostridium homopropionicum DSM 5847]|uniref:Peptidoglycan-N-acetylglucosamine deacetylase n=1 Tax=Clostridium homopropionicum DSM 5847 TaxID=1121318 RepID=A0A0L6Z8U3_9CLOT|nr:polysaccharide deacetylase family protein [Clostridium homopropionicum]KOA19390.1 peptidoglycan-N-acetylglucosamine deacetylase [Clostridium homopropionicum DSM 5847]SFG68300.1 Peptidoglycan/xylan/chitin deacetylase, PgdA/CDA1 family [Clostridium homopropionicum]